MLFARAEVMESLFPIITRTELLTAIYKEQVLGPHSLQSKIKTNIMGKKGIRSNGEKTC